MVFPRCGRCSMSPIRPRRPGLTRDSAGQFLMQLGPTRIDPCLRAVTKYDSAVRRLDLALAWKGKRLEPSVRTQRIRRQHLGSRGVGPHMQHANFHVQRIHARGDYFALSSLYVHVDEVDAIVIRENLSETQAGHWPADERGNVDQTASSCRPIARCP